MNQKKRFLNTIVASANAASDAYMTKEEVKKEWPGAVVFEAGNHFGFCAPVSIDSLDGEICVDAQIFAFRGTDEAADWINNISAWRLSPPWSDGVVHDGFYAALNELEWIHSINQNVPLIFCGHSLGGAMATIAAAIISRIIPVESAPEQVTLQTFGAPRVGDKRFVDSLGERCCWTRYTTEKDLVDNTPPWWLGYRHGGREIILNRKGHMVGVPWWKRLPVFRRFHAHSMATYQERVLRSETAL